MITPKTDIVQTVGRILRAKHAYSHPIVFDVVDSHDCFKNQWAKRRAYYKKQNYRIIGISNQEYSPDTTTWKTIYDRSGGTTGRKCSASVIDETSDDEPETKVYKC